MMTTTLTICLFLSPLVFGASTGLQKRFTCPSSWEAYGSSCYLFNAMKLSWADAMATCLAAGGRLVEVESAGERDYLTRVASAKGERYWIGCNNLGKPYNFVWASSQSTLTITNWSVGEPNNADQGENCCEVYISPMLGRWNDNDCSALSASVCEKPGV